MVNNKSVVQMYTDDNFDDSAILSNIASTLFPLAGIILPPIADARRMDGL